MGTWGSGIGSNDAFADVYGEFFDLYNDGGDPLEISGRLIEVNREMLGIPEEEDELWFAIARAQWECKCLQEDILEKVRSIIESGKNIKLWRDIGVDEKHVRKREAVLSKFLTKLGTEKAKPRARKKVKIHYPSFEKGDCLTFRLTNGNSGGVVVLEAESGKGYAYNLVAVSRINEPDVPTLEDFMKAEVLVVNFGKWEDVAAIFWLAPLYFADDKGIFEKVGTINVDGKFESVSSEYGYCGSWKGWIVGQLEKQLEFEKTGSKPKKSIRISYFLKANDGSPGKTV